MEKTFDTYKKDKNFLKDLKKLMIYCDHIKELLDSMLEKFPLDKNTAYDINIHEKKILIVKKKK